MTPERINEIAYDAAVRYGTDGMLLHELIDRTIKAALDEVMGEEPSEEMLYAGSVAIQELYRVDGGWCGSVAAREQAILTWHPMAAAKRREWGGG